MGVEHLRYANASTGGEFVCSMYCKACEINRHLRCLEVLAHNLAWAATLCASFEMGRDAGPTSHTPWQTSWWRPGCGKPWAWPHVTRDDGYTIQTSEQL